MRTKLDNFTYLAVFSAALFLLLGCASVHRQDIYRYADNKPGLGVVYFVREHRFTGSAISYDIEENGKVIGALANGTYFFVYAQPGTHSYSASTEVTSTCKVEVEAGKTYYVEGRVKFGILAPRPSLTLENELRGRSLLSAARYAVK